MRKATTSIIIIGLALLGVGCVISGKSAKPVAATPAAPKPAAVAPAPPPPPLSIPQTQVELPAPQPLDPAALVTEPAPPAETPAETANPKPPTPGRRASQPRNEGTGGQPPPTAPAPAVPTNVAPPEPPPPTIQEIVPEQEKKRLQESAAGRRREAQQIVDQLTKRPLSPKQREVINNITSFIALSLDAEKKNDMKLADSLAERAQVLAKDQLNVK